MTKKRKSVERPYNAGTMTAAEKHTMIINALRKLSSWWKPLARTKAKARIGRGLYKCEKCGKEGREYSPAPPGKKRRIKNFHVDHKEPVVPLTGFNSYDEWIERCFIEEGEGLRMLCSDCHSGENGKTQKENKERKEIRDITKNMEGETYGRLSIIKGVGDNKVECECECGKTTIVSIYNLKNGHTRSCGCIMGTHKLSGSRIYKTWMNINTRCNNPNATGFKYYGGKGIKVEWDNFEDFYKDMGNIPEGKTIDRIDPNGNYSKENCRWATYKEQANNKAEKNHRITFEGETKTISEWADSIKIKPNTLLYRIRRGWTIGEALGLDERIIESKSILKKEYLEDILELLDKGKTQAEIGKMYGIDGSCVSRFLKKHK